jgi:hypothetical protein
MKYNTWGFMTPMICGLILEEVGNAGRTRLNDNIFNFNNFHLVSLLIL